jgi:hypothetical protein
MNARTNVFAAIGLADAEEKKADAELVLALATLSERARAIKQTEAADLILKGADRIAILNGFLKPGQTVR